MIVRPPDMHEGYVQPIQGGDRKGWFFAVCPLCGSSEFEDRFTREAALFDLERHACEAREAWASFTGSEPK